MDLGLKNKVVLVTGAPGGIGREIVRLFNEEGASVGIHYGTNRAGAQQLLHEVNDGQLFQADLRDPSAIAQMFADADNHFGHIDILVNNAGKSLREEVDIDERDADEWDEMFHVNLRAAGLCCGHFLRLLEAHHNAGSVVFIGSTAGVYGEMHNDVYATMKAGFHGLMLSFASKLGKLSPPGRANIVAPGWTITPMPAVREFLKNEAGVHRALQCRMIPDLCWPKDVAHQVVILASDLASRAVTGQTLVVDMGMNARTQWSPDNPRLETAYRSILDRANK